MVAQPGGSYRSKAESFTKLVPSGTCGDGPCSWVACGPSGVKCRYGITNDSSLRKQGTTSVRTWGLSRVEDVHGNYYSPVQIGSGFASVSAGGYHTVA